MRPPSFIFIHCLSSLLIVDAFLARRHEGHFAIHGPARDLRATSRFMTTDSSAALPSVGQLSNDPFMQQVQYGADLALAMMESPPAQSDGAQVEELIAAQLSHSDGIRGFFVSYLTIQGDDTAADQQEVPTPLQKAMKKANLDELVPLACMNVVMPTAMKTMHEDEELQVQSSITANRGIKILANLATLDAMVKVNCDAILAVAEMEADAATTDDGKIKYWIDFFNKWGYKDAQKNDIAAAIKEVLSMIQ
eukprot:CAMPEP_0198112458 /NCGR_PEP_ID=MMETSP1442-20131203/4306_1 /TAXON_ID= /ORGANISM="Craspedostauros australis, Strain CCMP3328" /LENGTH=249 /DNA_ID=CAMNT_0043769231 /DNA_START=33 /DNA_END=782 /DNA_ORIENTATION=+